MSLHYCLHGCPGYATRQFTDRGREVKIAGLAMFVCQTCGAEFSSPHETSVRDTPMYVVTTHKEDCFRCDGTIRFNYISTETNTAYFYCVGTGRHGGCGYSVGVPQHMWGELDLGIREVLDLMDAEDEE